MIVKVIVEIDADEVKRAYRLPDVDITAARVCGGRLQLLIRANADVFSSRNLPYAKEAELLPLLSPEQFA